MRAVDYDVDKSDIPDLLIHHTDLTANVHYFILMHHRSDVCAIYLKNANVDSIHGVINRCLVDICRC